MKICSKLIITTLFNLCFLNSNIANSCSPSGCPKDVNTDVFSTEVTVEYPFYVKDVQPESCGIPGFELYCDNTFGTLIKLPNNVVLRVDTIYYYYPRAIALSDPIDKCLPKKLMSLNLITTPFVPRSDSLKYWLYNCPGDDDSGYDRIDCLSDSNHSVISSSYDIIDRLSPSCTFMKFVFAPTYYSYTYLSNISAIELTWTGSIVPPPPGKYPNYRDTSESGRGSVLGILAAMITVICVLFCCCRFLVYRHERAMSTINTEAITNTRTDTQRTRAISTRDSAASVVVGLDQVTIDSYPIVVIGESGRLIKMHDNTCPICLDDYQPREILKMLPECLHRFHVDCIDQWLRSNGICPICRTSPSRHS